MIIDWAAFAALLAEVDEVLLCQHHRLELTVVNLNIINLREGVQKIKSTRPLLSSGPSPNLEPTKGDKKTNFSPFL